MTTIDRAARAEVDERRRERVLVVAEHDEALGRGSRARGGARAIAAEFVSTELPVTSSSPVATIATARERAGAALIAASIPAVAAAAP